MLFCGSVRTSARLLLLGTSVLPRIRRLRGICRMVHDEMMGHYIEKLGLFCASHLNIDLLRLAPVLFNACRYSHRVRNIFRFNLLSLVIELIYESYVLTEQCCAVPRQLHRRLRDRSSAVPSSSLSRSTPTRLSKGFLSILIVYFRPSLSYLSYPLPFLVLSISSSRPERWRLPFRGYHPGGGPTYFLGCISVLVVSEQVGRLYLLCFLLHLVF